MSNDNQQNQDSPFHEDKELFLFDALLSAMDGKSSSNAVLMQESRGQQKLVNSQALPLECPRAELEALGFISGEAIDDLFISVTMPDGWKKEAVDHSMHSNLIDPQGRNRGGIFYKAAFYDRSARMHLYRRYSYGKQPINGYEVESSYTDDKVGVVTDCGKIIYQTQSVGCKDYPAQDLVQAEAKAWLIATYPDYKNPLAYWD